MVKIRYRCARCGDMYFSTHKKLSLHSKRHLDMLVDMQLLQKGHVPQETKHGSDFRGKNKIVVG